MRSLSPVAAPNMQPGKPFLARKCLSGWIRGVLKTNCPRHGRKSAGLNPAPPR